MKDSEILSAFHDLPEATRGGGMLASRSATGGSGLLFDACQVGVVLRAVAMVELAMALGAMYSASSLAGWLTQMAMLTGGALPGCLLWLIAGCSLKHTLARLPTFAQYSAGIVLGALAGLLACAMVTLPVGQGKAPWLAAACTGAVLAGVQVMSLVMRARGRMPADATARLAELQARIRPHFLFNTLNSAIALVRREPARAEALLEDLSDLFRQALSEHGEATTLADEVRLARRYLDIEQVRFGPRLRVEWLLDPLADAARLPPLLLQPLVENAVKHGVEPSPQGAQLRISTQKRGDVVVIKVTNTVPAGQGERGHGVALDNVRRRLSLMHDVQSQFRASLVDGVYRVRIEVPL